MSEVLGTASKALGLEAGYTPDFGSFGPSGEESQIMQALMARAQGKGAPSPAELQQQAALQQQASQAQGMAAAQRGISPALAARQAQQAMGQAGMQAAQQAGVLRAQETMGAQQMALGAAQNQQNRRMMYEQMKQQEADKQIGRFTGALTAAGSAMAGVPSMFGSEAGVGGQAPASTGMSPKGNVLMAAKGGMVPDDIHNFAMAIGQHVGSMNMQKGGKVPGIAPVPHDSAENDIVPAMLSPGEIVIPRSIATKSPEEVAQFIMALRGGM